MEKITLKSTLSDNNFDVYETENIVEIGSRMQSKQLIAVVKNTAPEDITTENSYDITPDYVATLIHQSVENVVQINLINLNKRLNP